jgi:hypothetical protein
VVCGLHIGGLHIGGLHIGAVLTRGSTVNLEGDLHLSPKRARADPSMNTDERVLPGWPSLLQTIPQNRAAITVMPLTSTSCTAAPCKRSMDVP